MGKSVTSHPSAPPAWLDTETLAVVRPQVRALLESSPGFEKLSDEEKRTLAGTMVKVAAYMANPHGLAKEEPVSAGRRAGQSPSRCDRNGAPARGQRSRFCG